MSAMFTLAELESILPVVHAVVPPTPQYAWPLLRERTGVEVVVKHENHTPIGAFKVRGGVTYFDRLKRERPHVKGVVTATRGNHGQSIAFAGARAGIPVALVVPYGNAAEKNAAMRAFGAELIEHGRDFDEAKERAEGDRSRARLRVRPVVPPRPRDRRRDLRAMNCSRRAPDLDTVYVPIGLGSGICGVIAARDLLGLKTQRHRRRRGRRQRLSALLGCRPRGADQRRDHVRGRHGGACSRCRCPRHHPQAARSASSKSPTTRSRRRSACSTADAHCLAEGAGAGALAALMKERETLQGRRVAVIVIGPEHRPPDDARPCSTAARRCRRRTRPHEIPRVPKRQGRLFRSIPDCISLELF